MTATVEQAYRLCADVTRTEARNFFWGIRLLPAPKRAALCAVYALARRIDDIGDGPLPAERKLSELAGAREQLQRIGSDAADPVLVAVADAARHYPLPLEAFAELIDGVEMDVRGTTYATFDELTVYCRRVAGTIGRLCLGIYGATDLARASRLADDLGVALQQTNILRDVREDLLAGRVYLPAADLQRFGVDLGVDAAGRLGGPPEALAALVRFAAERAGGWYREGLGLLDMLDRRSAACTGAMAGIYVRINDLLIADPSRMTTGRLSLGGRQKAAVAVRALAGRRP